MTEEENQVVEQADPLVQATDQASESVEEQAERQQPQGVETLKRKDVDYNWNEARRRMAELERITREQQDVINGLRSGQKDEPSLSEDDLLTVKDWKKLDSKRDMESAKERQRYQEEILRLKFPDIDQVLSQENIAYFEQNEPELAESLLALSGDPIKMKQAAYKLIKKSVPQHTPPSMEKKKAELNAKKPVSVQAVAKGNSPIGNAHLFENGLTPELRKQLYAEMQDSIKRG